MEQTEHTAFIKFAVSYGCVLWRPQTITTVTSNITNYRASGSGWQRTCVHLLLWPKLQLAVEQPLTGGCWNLPKPNTLCPKTKKKLQRGGRRGIIMIKSIPIPAVWVTHKLENNNTKEVLPLLWRFWPLRQASQPGDLTNGLGIPRESDLEAQWDLITKLPQDWGKQRLQSWRAQRSLFIDHHNKSLMMKKCEIFWELTKCDTETWSV